MKVINEFNNLNMYSYGWITWPKNILHTDFHKAGKSLKFDSVVRFPILNTYFNVFIFIIFFLHALMIILVTVFKNLAGFGVSGN